MDNIKKECDEIMNMLPPNIFINHEYDINEFYYIQHYLNAEIAWQKFKKVCSLIFKTNLEKYNRQSYYIGRLLDDSDNNELYTHFLRFTRIDDELREWNRPLPIHNIEIGQCVNHLYPDVIAFYRDKKINEILNK